MPDYSEQKAVCPFCGGTSTVRICRSVNAAADPELKDEVRSGRIFLHECPSCGRQYLIGNDMLYHDPDARFLICLSSTQFNSDGLEGYTCRIVRDAGSLIEKVKIFEAGLDDVVIELCKYVTASELGKEVDLKFFKMDGPDNAITLVYPQNGEMEIVEIGFNVYEDCAGIVGRNPSMKEAASGLARIDREWLLQFLA